MPRASTRRRTSPDPGRSPRGRRRHLAVPSRALGAEVPVAIWSPPGVRSGRPLPLLVAHDGPDYARRTALLRPGCRVALLSAPKRDEWYSASAAYSRALAEDVLPAVTEAVAVEGRPVAAGASLGALQLLHAHRRHPGTFAGLLLQSGSFFVPRLDAKESGFMRFGRITRFVRSTLRETGGDHAVPVVMTCGAEEENLDNNRLMAAALAVQRYPVRLHEVPGGHDWDSWAIGVDRHLPELLRACWG